MAEGTVECVTDFLPRLPRPERLPRAEWGNVQVGWTCNEYRDYTQVWKVWRQGDLHYDNAELNHGSRGGCVAYATEAEAWLELEWRYLDQWRGKVENARRLSQPQQEKPARKSRKTK